MQYPLDQSNHDEDDDVTNKGVYCQPNYIQLLAKSLSKREFAVCDVWTGLSKNKTKFLMRKMLILPELFH